MTGDEFERVLDVLYRMRNTSRTKIPYDKKTIFNHFYPAGQWKKDEEGNLHWHPSFLELQECCRSIKLTKKGLYQHCMTKKHIRNLLKSLPEATFTKIKAILITDLFLVGKPPLKDIPEEDMLDFFIKNLDKITVKKYQDRKLREIPLTELSVKEVLEKFKWHYRNQAFPHLKEIEEEMRLNES